MDEASDASRTDWQRVRNLTDAEIDAAIAKDADWAAFEDDEFRKASTTRYIFQKFGDTDGRWRWRLVAEDGSVIAVSPIDFASENAVVNAIRGLQAALIGGQPAA